MPCAQLKLKSKLALDDVWLSCQGTPELPLDHLVSMSGGPLMHWVLVF